MGIRSMMPGASLRRLQALGRKKQGEMNKTEQSYADFLEKRRQAGEIEWFRFEGLKLRLADKTFYEPDFFVMLANGELEAHEVKGGYIFEDAKIKLKIAASTYPFRFYIVKPRAKRDGGGFSIEEV
jgi:hypothetical protein